MMRKIISVVGSRKVAGILMAALMVASVIQPALVGTPKAFAADTGFHSPTSSTSPEEWSSEDNAFSSNDSYATESDDGDDQGYKNFNIPTIPAAATIDGIKVTVEAFSQKSSTIISDNFGTSGSNSSDITGWDERGDNDADEGTIARAPSGSGENTTSPDGGRFALIEGDDGYICQEFDTSSLSSAQLSYYWRGDADAEDGEFGRVQYRPNNGASCNSNGGFIDVATHELDDNNNGTSTWSSLQTVSVPSDTDLLVRFLADSGQENESFRIDGVSIGGTPTITSELHVRIGDTGTSPFATTPKVQALTDTETVYTLGGPSDLWGQTWTPSSFTNSNFRLEVELENPSSGETAKLDHVQVKVYYSLPDPTITVTKIIDQDGNLSTTNDQSTASGWVFDVAGTSRTTGGNGQTEAVELDPGTYSVTETVQSGYAFIGASCEDQDQQSIGSQGQNSVTGIGAEAGDTITCTFYNAPLPTLTVVKTVVNNASNTQNLASGDFTINVKDAEEEHVSGSPTAGSAQGTTYTLAPGSYTVSEDAVAGYTANFDGCNQNGAFSLGYGDAEVCTIVNSEDEIQTGTLIVVKQVINNHGGTTPAEQFPITVQDSQQQSYSPSNTALGQNIVTYSYTNLTPGTYTVSEPANSAYQADFEECESYGQGEGYGDGVVTVAAGQSVTCTIVNDDKPGILIVEKVLVNNEGQTEGQMSVDDFSFSVNEDDPINFEEDGENELSVSAGTYTVIETSVEGYDVSYSYCEEVYVGNGQTKTCTITNTQQSLKANLHVRKTADAEAVSPGGFVTYTVIVTNEGPNDAENVKVDDILSSLLTLISSTSTQGSYNADTGVWDVGFLAEGGSATLTLNVQVKQGTGGNVVINNANGTSTVSDEESGNNSDSISLQIATQGGGGGGFPGSSGNTNGGSQGQVLGAATSTEAAGQPPIACAAYLAGYLKYGGKNDPEQVKKLQMFLNEVLGTNLAITGIYGPETRDAVKEFQLKFKDEILMPWVPFGLPNSSTPTGFVYKTTLRWINKLKCASLDLPMPQLP